ncbi:GAF domain-containing protein [Marmoricola sp. URHA0025 HA25]
MNESQENHDTSRQAALVAQSFVALADTLVDDFDVVELLDRLVADCVTLIGVDAAAILLVNRDRHLEVVASSNEASYLMEVFQLESRSGPCLEAVETGEPVSVTDLGQVQRRWPAFSHAIEGVGFSAVYALPMRLREEKIGALNLFNSTQPPLSEFDARLAQALADVATIGILQQRTVSRASILVEQLQLALSTRISVEQAKGVIAEFGGLDMGVAFEAIRAYARSNHLKLSAVAEALVRRELEPARVIPRRTSL